MRELSMSALVQSPSRKENLQHESSLASSARALIASTLVGLWTSSANANILLFSANITDQNITGTQLLSLNGSNSGGTTLTFHTTQSNQRVSVIFDTTCFISSPNSWAIVKILVTPAGSSVPIVAPPTNAIANDGAFFLRRRSTERNLSTGIRRSFGSPGD